MKFTGGMEITEVSVQVRSVRGAADFYEGVLGLDVMAGRGSLVVTIGPTRLTLIEDPETAGDHHFAITIPSNKFTEAKNWIQRRTQLLGTSEADEFECSPVWNAHSLYFAGPDRSVLEFIIRRDLDNATPGPFTSADLLCISEVGVAVSDVPAVVESLDIEAAISPYAGTPDSTFAPLGDVHGLVIAVMAGRVWFPTIDRVADESPISITAVGQRPGTYSVGTLGSLRIVS